MAQNGPMEALEAMGTALTGVGLVDMQGVPAGRFCALGAAKIVRAEYFRQASYVDSEIFVSGLYFPKLNRSPFYA